MRSTHLSRANTNVYISVGGAGLYKGHFNRTAFIKSRIAHTVEHQATYLKVVGSGSTVGKNFSFCILSLSTRSWQVDWSYTNEIKHKIHPKY